MAPDFGDASPKCVFLPHFCYNSRTPYGSYPKYAIFLRHPNHRSKSGRMPCLSGFQEIGIA